MKVNFRSKLSFFVMFFVVFTLVILLLPCLQAAWDFNRLAILTSRALFGDARLLPVAEAAMVSLGPQNCLAKLYQGLIAQDLNKPAQRDAFWVELLRCSPDYLSRMHILAPDNAILAEFVTLTYPDLAEGWFWLAEVRGSTTPPEAIALYQRGLELDPNDAWSWCALGGLLSKYDLQAAAEAAAQCCLRGDPDCVGCDRAGLYYERVGDVQTALYYMRRSRCSSVLNLVVEWERKLQNQP